MTDPEKHRLSTRLAHAGRAHAAQGGRSTVNPQITRASTVLLPDAAALYSQDRSPYGRMGHAVHRELEDTLCALEGGVGARLTPNGLTACTLALSAMVSAGDELLVTDSVYGPTRRFCTRYLERMGVSTRFFDPRIGAGIEALISGRTRAIMLESPGSLTFEIHDTPAILAVTRPRGILSAMDNTWSAGVFHQPLALGVDFSVQALTKYAVGHADAFGGVVVAREAATLSRLDQTVEDFGTALGPDDAYAALRGLRTLTTRLDAHQQSALTLAHWFAGHKAVEAVLHPALPQHPDHDLWKRDFTGSTGLFGVVFKPEHAGSIDAALNRLELFGFGFSWGGFESLAIPCTPQLKRTATPDTPKGPLVRIHAGLEAPEDLIADLDQALAILG